MRFDEELAGVTASGTSRIDHNIAVVNSVIEQKEKYDLMITMQEWKLRMQDMKTAYAWAKRQETIDVAKEPLKIETTQENANRLARK